MWTHLKTLAGAWRGTGSGQPGESTVERAYRFVLNEKFLEVRNKSTYLPQTGNPNGEVHEDFGLISFDEARGKHVFRQFHIEGFVESIRAGRHRRR